MSTRRMAGLQTTETSAASRQIANQASTTKASPPAATGTWLLLAAPDEPSENSQLMNTNEAQRKVVGGPANHSRRSVAHAQTPRGESPPAATAPAQLLSRDNTRAAV